MLNYETFLTFIFRILNFGVFVGVCWYVYKRYVRPMSEMEMASQEGFIKGLQEQKNVLEARGYELNNQVAQQQEYAQSMSRKIELWKERFEVQLAQKDKDKEVLKEAVVNRLNIQTQSLEQEYIKRQIVPGALKKAEEELATYFNQTAHQREYIHEVLSCMKRKDADGK